MIIIFWAALLIPSSAPAITTAPRISDREIIESLAILKQGQTDMNRRFDDVNQRISGLQNTMLVMFGAIITLIAALFGYIAWDRRTAMQPLQEDIKRIEQELHTGLEINHQGGSLLIRILKVLREAARDDMQLAKALRTYSLL